MATQSDEEEGTTATAEGEALPAAAEGQALTAPETADVAQTLGSQRYVHAAFFATGILVAFLASKTLAAAWSELADWPAAVRAVPQLVSFPEDERDGIMLTAGAVIGIATVVQIYRKEGIRTWADEVAAELAKVSWPNRETVVNGTLVVVIASAIATVYVAILDRFWSFLTTLVYGT